VTAVSDESVRLVRLTEEFTERLRSGERPGIEDYARLHPDLAPRIRRLFPALVALEGAGGGDAPPALAPGRLFGRYRIEGEIGRGGMGVVHDATHVALGKRVALKVLAAGNADRTERFLREARTAAQLHHTNIVPVFDVGEAEGVPYYAMERIEGLGLDQAARPREAGPRFRWIAELGAQAADALEHAHRRGVIHRDVKPSNLLVDAGGVLWVTDFGLARRAEDPSLTSTRAIVGTPRFMSPEQAEATRQGVDHRTDVYSLGATLYELLAGRPAFEGETMAEVVRQVLTREPLRPRRIDPLVPRELETVVLKAMAKRPEDRYPTARALAEDLRRWLAREPVRAQPAGPWLRLRRWAQRNPMLATAVAGVFASLAAGLCVSLVLLRANQEARRRAEANLGQAIAAVDRMLTTVGVDVLSAAPRMEETRRELLEEALRFYEGFLAERADDARLGLETARARRRVGSLLTSLGDHPRAEAALRRAIEECERLGAASDLQLARLSLGELLLVRGCPGEAEAVLLRSLPPPTPLGMLLLGRALQELGRRRDAAGACRHAAALAGRLGPGAGATLAACLGMLATALQAREPDPEAEAALALSLTLRREACARTPEQPGARFDLARSLASFGWARALAGRVEEADAACAEALALAGRLADDFPLVPEYPSFLANEWNNRGNLMSDARRDEEAAACYEKAIATAERLAGRFPGVPAHESLLGSCCNNLGKLFRERGELEKSRAALERAVRHQRRAVAAGPGQATPRSFLASHLWNLALTLVRLQDAAGVAAAAEELAGVGADPGAEAWRAGRLLARCAVFEREAGRADTERARADRAMALLRAAVERDAHDFGYLRDAHDLDALRAREDFRGLLRDARARERVRAR
jgi:tetratricopeptide (TPR) repeat protein